MSRTRHDVLFNPQETIKCLQDELYEARTTIISLMSEDAQKILESYRWCESRKETYSWQENVAERIIALAKILSPEQGSYLSERAYCPLCGEGSSSPYESGFSIPEGLRRHLVGYGNVQQCKVMEAAKRLAGEYWHDKFDASEKAEQKQKRESIAQRRASETLYRTAPDSEPKLIDEGYFYGGSPRNQSELDVGRTAIGRFGVPYLL